MNDSKLKAAIEPRCPLCGSEVYMSENIQPPHLVCARRACDGQVFPEVAAEPTWTDGDVIRLSVLEAHNPYATFIRMNAMWEGVHSSTLDPSRITRFWSEGAVEILHKVDPPFYGPSVTA